MEAVLRRKRFSEVSGFPARYAATVGLLLAGCGQAIAAPTLSPIWGDDAVIQRDRPIVIEGRAAPGEKLSVTLGGETRAAKAGRDGRFSVSFTPRAASTAPVALEAVGADGSAVRHQGLVVGDVWVCSGQSNMEFTVDRGLNGYNEANGSNDPLLRMVTIAKKVHHQPRSDFDEPVHWKRTAPENTPGFSAACYYMAKELRQRLNIPIGTIHSSWGGSASRPWLTPEGGRAIYGDGEMAMLQLYADDPIAAITVFAPRWEGWYREQSGGVAPWTNPEQITWSDVPAMSDWSKWSGTPLADNPVSTVFVRRTISLSAEQAAGDARLLLGALDDMDMTWVNGHAVGNSYGWDSDRNYRVPASFLKEGLNEIVLAVTNTWGPGGFVGGGANFAFQTGNGGKIALDGGWRYARAAASGSPPRSPWDRQGGIGVMHNAMIAPIGHYAAAGMAWYQGESDVGTPGYARRMKALFAGWREQFGASVRMLVVQLANFGPPQLHPQESGWADLREEQRKAVLADGNAALVTAIDIGERTDIHPANKTVLGKRLASAAIGEALPQPVSARREGGAVRVRFSGVTGKLNAWSGASPLGFELCGEGQGSCRYAGATVDGDSVLLTPDGMTATRVRYAWADSPTVNLFDAKFLPPPSFELAIEP